MNRKPDEAATAAPARLPRAAGRNLTLKSAAQLIPMKGKRATEYFLDLARSRGYSDYSLARHLGVTPQAISQYRHGRTMNDEVGHALARLVRISREFALACLNGERARSPALRRTWMNAARMIARTPRGK
jgi:hypothetical protein